MSTNVELVGQLSIKAIFINLNINQGCVRLKTKLSKVITYAKWITGDLTLSTMVKDGMVPASVPPTLIVVGVKGLAVASMSGSVSKATSRITVVSASAAF